MKQLLLGMVVLLSLGVLLASLFCGGNIRLLGVPISGLLFVVIIREAIRRMER